MTKKSYAFIGTYTEDYQRGIFMFEYDVDNGHLKKVCQCKNYINAPAFISVNEEQNLLYACSDSGNRDGNGGSVATYRINYQKGELEYMDSILTDGDYTCHILLDLNNRKLFASNYDEGSISMFSLDENGRLSKSSRKTYKQEGCSVNEQRQTKSHIHNTCLTPDNKWLYALNLGTDRIEMYEIFKDYIVHVPGKSLKVHPGYGPRHLIFHPNGDFAYFSCELIPHVAVAKYDRDNHSLEIIQYLSTVRTNTENMCSTLRITGDGNFLYVANRGENSIACYSIDKGTGMLTLRRHIDSMGVWPREIEIDPSGRFLFVLNQLSDSIAKFRINHSDGFLEHIETIASISQPACIVFSKEC